MGGRGKGATKRGGEGAKAWRKEGKACMILVGDRGRVETTMLEVNEVIVEWGKALGLMLLEKLGPRVTSMARADQ